MIKPLKVSILLINVFKNFLYYGLIFFTDELKKSNETITKLSNKIKWSKDALEEWRLAAARGDQTNKMIAKYSKEDSVLADVIDFFNEIFWKN